MTLQDVLNAVCDGISDSEASRKLNISRITFSRYRNGHKIPSDDVLDRMAEIARLDPVEVYLAAYAERVHNPKVAEAFRHLAA